jgi:hypothetical protein
VRGLAPSVAGAGGSGSAAGSGAAEGIVPPDRHEPSGSTRSSAVTTGDDLGLLPENVAQSGVVNMLEACAKGLESDEGLEHAPAATHKHAHPANVQDRLISGISRTQLPRPDASAPLSPKF